MGSIANMDICNNCIFFNNIYFVRKQMNFNELDKEYSYYNNNDYKKYIADDIYKLELIKYLQEAQNNPIIIKPAKNKCKFFKCYCRQDRYEIVGLKQDMTNKNNIPKTKY